MIDLIIKNGMVYDGDNHPGEIHDVAISGDRIVGIGRFDAQCGQVIDARGLIVCPGFIDAHTHADNAVFDRDSDLIKLMQGVTSIVVGNCGFATAPMTDAHRGALLEYGAGVMAANAYTQDKLWPDFAAYWADVGALRPRVNIGALTGNGAIRIAVKGFEDTSMTPPQMRAVKKHVRSALDAGALGLSMGLMYAPEFYYTEDELTDIAAELTAYDGLLVTHIRGESGTLVRSIDEVISIARRTGIRLQISHFKAAGRNVRGHGLHTAMEHIEYAIRNGVDIACDVYPYTAGSTILSSLLPTWALAGGTDQLMERLKDNCTRGRIRRDMTRESGDWDNIILHIGWENVMLASVGDTELQHIIGRHVAELADMAGTSPEEYTLRLIERTRGDVTIVITSMDESDVISVLRFSHSFLASDSLYGKGLPHPRLYGAFPRLFGRYVREKKILTLQQAIHKTTGLPAHRFRLHRRGILKPGNYADITVFDPDTIADTATYAQPRMQAEGIRHVVVNGALTVSNGIIQDQAAGRRLTRQEE